MERLSVQGFLCGGLQLVAELITQAFGLCHNKCLDIANIIDIEFKYVACDWNQV